MEDLRNTDNAWIETTAVNYHDDTKTTFHFLDFGSGAADVCLEWVQLDDSLPIRPFHLELLSFV